MKKGTASDGVVYHAGFPNAGEDQRFESLSIDQLIFRHRASTYLWRIDSQGVPQLGWQAGTIVAVDRALGPREGDLVVAVVDEDFTVRRYRSGKIEQLDGRAETSQEISLWGVITHAVQEYRTP